MTTDFHWSVISARRPENVPLMQERTGVNLTWYVTEGDVQDYEAAGASDVVVGGAISESRNKAIDDAQQLGKPCVELSDDFKRVRRKEVNEVVDLTVQQAADEIWAEMNNLGARLGGCAPTSNAYWSDTNKPVNLTGFVVGDFIVIHPETPLRFDETMTLKEDYDYTAQQLRAHKLVARCDLILAEFAHRSNKGGAVAYRTPAKEREMILHLMHKWPNKFRLNPKRDNEIIMRW
jgi:hypothetical protein